MTGWSGLHRKSGLAAIVLLFGSLSGCAMGVDTGPPGENAGSSNGGSRTTFGTTMEDAAVAPGAGGNPSTGDNTGGGAGTAGQSSASDGGPSDGASDSASEEAISDSEAGVPAVVPNAIESISVAADGGTAAGKAMLTAGDLFLLKATGTVDAGGTALDAEYGGFTAAAAGQDSVAGTDVGVDVGFKVERTPQGTTAGRKKWFGTYRSDHTYYVIVTGAGAPLSLKLIRAAGTAGSGAITVSLFRLSPTAPVLAPALETLMAPVTQQTVHSTMVPAQSVVYLLQASGQGKVGGNNLGMGDADWMDYAANGSGKVDIGDQNVDYGLGVDESNPKVTPRRIWWGPWRMDHTYFTLYEGTGSAVGFTYYDVGYADNSKTDMLTVHVFAAP
jgi:hypothetical protein